MSGANQILPFAIGGGANVLTPSQYAAMSARPTGFAAGVAQSAQLNTVWRQSSFVASAIAQMMADVNNTDVNDDGVINTFERNFALASNLVSYGLDTGAANAYTVAYAVPVMAKVDGLRLRFKAINANTGASTFAPNGLAASPIYSANYAPLTAGAIVAGGEVEVVWNITLNSGAGAWVLLGSTGGTGSPTGTTAAQFDNSTLLATTAFVQANGQAFAGRNLYTTSQVLTAAADVGKHIDVGGAGGTLTLPLANSIPIGAGMSIACKGVNVSITRQSTDTISIGSLASTATFSMTGSDHCIIVRSGASAWEVIHGTPVLQQRDGIFKMQIPDGSGFGFYQRFPSGLIMQAGATPLISAGTTGTFSYPLAYPATLAAFSAIPYTNTPAVGSPFSTSTFSLTALSIVNGGSSSCQYFYLSFGFSGAYYHAVLLCNYKRVLR